MKHYKSFLKWLAHLQVQHPWLIILFLASLTLVFSVYAAQVETVASLELMMPATATPIAGFETLRDLELGQDTVAVYVFIDRESATRTVPQTIRDPQVIAYLEELEDELVLWSDVERVQSIASNPEFYVTADEQGTILLVSSSIGRDDARMTGLVDELFAVANEGLPAGVSVSITGTPAVQQKLGTLISADRKNTQLYSTLFVLVILLLTFGTLSSAFVPLLVVTTSVTWLYGTMTLTNLPISTLAGGVAAMVIGIGIDFAIHIMNKFKWERKRKNSIAKSIELAIMETGTSLTITSLTTIAAFLAFMAGVMPEMARFGILMSLGIFYALFFSIVGLPAALIIEEQLIKKFVKKAHFGVEGEYVLKKEDEK